MHESCALFTVVIQLLINAIQELILANPVVHFSQSYAPTMCSPAVGWTSGTDWTCSLESMSGRLFKRSSIFSGRLKLMEGVRRSCCWPCEGTSWKATVVWKFREEECGSHLKIIFFQWLETSGPFEMRIMNIHVRSECYFWCMAPKRIVWFWQCSNIIQMTMRYRSISMLLYRNSSSFNISQYISIMYTIYDAKLHVGKCKCNTDWSFIWDFTCKCDTFRRWTIIRSFSISSIKSKRFLTRINNFTLLTQIPCLATSTKCRLNHRKYYDIYCILKINFWILQNNDTNCYVVRPIRST